MRYLAARATIPKLRDLTEMRSHPRADIIAGLSVAVVALPLSLAFGVNSGVGASAGIATAVIAGVVAAIFGGSRVQVSGPTGAMTVVLIPISAQFGAEAVLTVGFIAGIILVLGSWLGAAHAMRYIPISVIEGFTIGIACLLAMQQVPAAFGLQADSTSTIVSAFHAVKMWTSSPDFAALAISLACVIAILLIAKRFPHFPAAITTVVLSTIAVLAFKLDVPTVGKISSNLEWVGFPNFHSVALASLIIPALSVAGLAALESLLSATVADTMKDQEDDFVPHNPHQEVFGQGLANLAAPLFGGVPATAAFARTAVNVKSGGRTRLASIIQSLALLAFVGIGAQFVANIPLSSLAGVLIATSIRMIDVDRIKEFANETKAEFGIVAVTAMCTLFLDLIEAVALGMVLTGLLSFSQNRRTHQQHEHQVEQAEVALHHIAHHKPADD